jgi:hypothetical protein
MPFIGPLGERVLHLDFCENPLIYKTLAHWIKSFKII